MYVFLKTILKMSFSLPKGGLLAISSADESFYDDGEKTGVFFVEALHPFQYFRSQGFEVTIASETGKFVIDPHSLQDAFMGPEDKSVYQNSQSDFMQSLNNCTSAGSLAAQDFGIFFAAGGHGAAIDFPHAAKLHKLAAEIYKNGGVVSAVCHGPCFFDGLQNAKTGRPLVAGTRITGFTDNGEVVMKVDQAMKRKGMLTVKQVAEKVGATYVAPKGDWDDFTVTDGKIVTGVNPASAKSTAAKAVSAFGNV